MLGVVIAGLSGGMCGNNPQWYLEIKSYRTGVTGQSVYQNCKGG